MRPCDKCRQNAIKKQRLKVRMFGKTIIWEVYMCQEHSRAFSTEEYLNYEKAKNSIYPIIKELPKLV